MDNKINIDEIINKISGEENEESLNKNSSNINSVESEIINENKKNISIDELKDEEILKYRDKESDEEFKNRIQKYGQFLNKKRIYIWVFSTIALVASGVSFYFAYTRNESFLEYNKMKVIYERERVSIRNNEVFTIVDEELTNNKPVEYTSIKSFNDFYRYWNTWTDKEKKGFAMFIFEFCWNLNYSTEKINEIKSYSEEDFKNTYLEKLKAQTSYSYNISKSDYIDLLNKESEIKYINLSSRDYTRELASGCSFLVMGIVCITMGISGLIWKKKEKAKVEKTLEKMSK